MPGRDYTEAFARLSPTIQDIFQTYETKRFGPDTARENHDIPSWHEPIPFAQPSGPHQIEIKPQPNEHQQTATPTQNPSFELPPTPPQNISTNNATDAVQTSPNALSGVSTPTNKKSLPTPDVTPPSANPELPRVLNLESSLSFQTARDDTTESMTQSFNARRISDESDVTHLEDDMQSSRRVSERSDAFDLIDANEAAVLLAEVRRTPSLKKPPDVKALVGHWERESKRFSLVSDADTFLSSRPRDSWVSPISPAQNEQLPWELGFEEPERVVAQNVNNESATEILNLPDNEIEHENHSLCEITAVTVGQDCVQNPLLNHAAGHTSTPDTSILRGPGLDHVRTDVTHQDSQSEEPSPLTPADHVNSTRNGPESEEPSPITPAEHRELEKMMFQEQPIRDGLHVRKFSSTSSPGSARTTIVNAIVVDTSSITSLPRLRHVAKTSSLRSAASKSDRSNRTSMHSDDSTPHRLTRKKNITPERRVQYPEERAHPHGDLKGLRLFSEHGVLANRPWTAPERYDSPLGMLRRTSRPGEIIKDDGSLPRNFNGVKRLSDPFEPQAIASTTSNTDRLSKTGSSEIPIIFEGHPDLENLRDISREPRQRNGDQSPGRSTHREPKSSIASPLVARFSVDQSTIATESLPRPSLEQAGPIMMMHEGSPVHHQVYKLTSPITLHSNFSTLEVREATAVSIYPHTNSSLLMVHHNAMEDALGVPLTSPQLQTTISKAVIQAQPSSPEQARLLTFPERRDSPLMNPRAAPEPPAVAVIPPTPAQELDEAETARANTNASKRPQYIQGSTLINRARRYSGSVLHPLVSSFGPGNLTRQNTRARFYYGTGSRRRISSAPNVGRNSSLHPFWRPRGFWEEEEVGELENKYDDYDEDENNAYNDNDNETKDNCNDKYTMNRQPAAASTARRDITELQKYNNNSHWRRGGSLRGFLIGNTLGLERGPTNRRRHVVALPARMKGKAMRRRKSQAARGKKDDAAKNVSLLSSSASSSTTHASPAAASLSKPSSLPMVTVRDSARRSGSARGHGGGRSSGYGRRSLKPVTAPHSQPSSTLWPFQSWKSMIEQRQQRQTARHYDENL